MKTILFLLVSCAFVTRGYFKSLKTTVEPGEWDIEDIKDILALADNNSSNDKQRTSQSIDSLVGGNHADDEDREEIDGDNPCKSDPCQNGGTCNENEENGFTCSCESTHTGDTCENEVSPCESNPCLNGGTCNKNEENGFTCSCESTHTGDTCDKEVGPCEPNPCQNGGTCNKKEENGFTCSCESTHTGDTCEKEVGPCEPNPCQNGGTCNKKENGFTCSCESTHTGNKCEKEVGPCEPNPCLNGGTCNKNEKVKSGFTCSCPITHSGTKCEKVEPPCKKNPCGPGKCVIAEDKKNYKCLCNKGYKFNGKDCNQIEWCEDVGNQLCPGNCKMDSIAGMGYCECSENKYFNHEKNECQDIDESLLGWCKLNEEYDKTEEKDKCKCKTNYENIEGKCVSIKFCKNKTCPEGNECRENEGDPQNPICVCKKGYFYTNGACQPSHCFIPGKSSCKQVCNFVDDKQECDCHYGFTLKEDKKTCNRDSDDKCELKCTNGQCYNDGQEESCVCPPGYIIKDDKTTCVVDNAVLCHGKVYDAKTKRCQCDGEYTLAEDSVTCRPKRCSDKGIKEECTKLGGSCVDNEDGFACECPPGYQMSGKPESCRALCDLTEHESKCLENDKICEVVFDHSDEATTNCICPPAFKENKDGACELAQHSYLYSSVPIALSQRTTFSEQSQLLQIENDFRQSLPQLFPDFSSVTLLECNKMVLDVTLDAYTTECSLELKFSNSPGIATLERFKLQKACNKLENQGKLCLIPPRLYMKLGDLNKITYKKADLCTNEIKNKMCGEISTCSDNHCSCDPGFKSIAIKVTEEYTIKRCEDIDECKKPNTCHVNTTCVNTLGDFHCKCNPGFERNGSKVVEDKSPCLDICRPGACGRGKCDLVGDYGKDCTCEKGITGYVCDQKDPHYMAAKKATAVTGAILGVLLGLTILAFFVTYRRMKKHSYSQEFSPRHMDTEMSERHSREGVSNRGYQ